MISPTQRLLTANTQYLQETDIQDFGGIRTRNSSRRAAADPHLRPHGHLDRDTSVYISRTCVDVNRHCACRVGVAVRCLFVLVLLCSSLLNICGVVLLPILCTYTQYIQSHFRKSNCIYVNMKFLSIVFACGSLLLKNVFILFYFLFFSVSSYRCLELWVWAEKLQVSVTCLIVRKGFIKGVCKSLPVCPMYF